MQQVPAGVEAPPPQALWASEFAKLRSKWKVCLPSELRRKCEELGKGRFLIEGLLPEGSLDLLIGDSGLGKSPLAYQMGICVAAGVPFLGARVVERPVLYLDFENGSWQIYDLVARLSRHVGLTEPPENLMLWNINDAPLDFGQQTKRLDMIKDLKPGLIVIDPLSGLFPEIEMKNSDATKTYQELRVAMRRYKCAILGLHHLKKPSLKPGEKAVSLEDDHFRKWFLQARGAGVLVNGADVRLGMDIPSTSVGGNADIALVVRGYARIRGEIPTMYLGRIFDQDGEPLGYRKLTGVRLLRNAEQEKAYCGLPDSFDFKTAKRIYGKQDQATSEFLGKCIAKGILRKVSRGNYEKLKVAE